MGDESRVFHLLQIISGNRSLVSSRLVSTTHKTQNNTQNTTHNTQHTTHNTQHTKHNTQHTTHNTQHTTHITQHNCSLQYELSKKPYMGVPGKRLLYPPQSVINHQSLQQQASHATGETVARGKAVEHNEKIAAYR